MNRIEKLIEELCPDGVEFKEMWEITAWDKKFNGLDKYMQKRIINYPYVLANKFKELELEKGNVRLLSTGTYIGWTTEELAGKHLCNGEIVAIPWGGKANVKYFKGKFVTADNRIATSIDTNVLLNKFLYYWMIVNTELIESFYRGAGIKHPSMKSVLSMKIPIPPLPIQQEIVSILDTFTSLDASLQAELEARRKQYEHYRDQLLSFEGNMVEWKLLGDVCNVKNGYTPSKANDDYWDNGTIPWFRLEDIRINGRILNNSMKHVTIEAVKRGILFPVNSIILSTTATIGEHALIKVESLCNQQFTNISIKDNSKKYLSYKFLFYYMYIVSDWCKMNVNKGGFPIMDLSKLKKLKIPIPSLSEQQRIVAILDKFDALVNTELPAEIAARRKQYEYYREKLLTFKPLKS